MDLTASADTNVAIEIVVTVPSMAEAPLTPALLTLIETDGVGMKIRSGGCLIFSGDHHDLADVSFNIDGLAGESAVERALRFLSGTLTG